MIRERYGSQVAILPAGEEPSWGDRRAGLLAANGVTVHTGRLVAVEGERRGATLRAIGLEGGECVKLDFAFIAMGLYRVYNDLAVALEAELEPSDEPEERRHVLVDRNGETSVRGLFAVGDMAQRRDERIMKQIYTAQEYAVRAVDTIDRRRRSRQREALTPSE